jgi:hypothetical protein
VSMHCSPYRTKDLPLSLTSPDGLSSATAGIKKTHHRPLTQRSCIRTAPLSLTNRRRAASFNALQPMAHDAAYG